MTRFTMPRRLRLAFIWGAAFTLLLGFRYEMDYRDRLSSLPSLVDALGNTASLETAIAGMDSYERARQIRRYGFVSLGVGALLCAGAAHHETSERGVTCRLMRCSARIGAGSSAVAGEAFWSGWLSSGVSCGFPRMELSLRTCGKKT